MDYVCTYMYIERSWQTEKGCRQFNIAYLTLLYNSPGRNSQIRDSTAFTHLHRIEITHNNEMQLQFTRVREHCVSSFLNQQC